MIFIIVIFWIACAFYCGAVAGSKGHDNIPWFFGVLFFIIVRNALKKKLEILVEEEKKRKSNNFD